MRRGQDRHELGATVAATLFPDDAAFLLGIALGTPIADIVARLGTPQDDNGRQRYRLDVPDPADKGRRLDVRIHQQLARAHIVTASFYSSDRIDVDAAYQQIRKHLKGHHGRPDKEMTGVLKFLYSFEGPEFAGVTSIRC